MFFQWWHTRWVPTAVLLIRSDGSKECVRNSHIHGVREGQLLLATGRPGAGLDVSVIREVGLADLVSAETVEQEADPRQTERRSGWVMGWDSSEG